MGYIFYIAAAVACLVAGLIMWWAFHAISLELRKGLVRWVGRPLLGLRNPFRIWNCIDTHTLDLDFGGQRSWNSHGHGFRGGPDITANGGFHPASNSRSL